MTIALSLDVDSVAIYRGIILRNKINKPVLDASHRLTGARWSRRIGHQITRGIFIKWPRLHPVSVLLLATYPSIIDPGHSLIVMPSLPTMRRSGLLAVPLLVSVVSSVAVVGPYSLYLRETAPFEPQGCFHEPPRHEGRALKGQSFSSDFMTTERCADFCADFQYFGTEYARECFCGNSLAPNTASAEGGCTMPCTGDETQMCGAGDHISIYLNKGYIATSTAAVEGYTHLGCRTEAPHRRTLPDRRIASDDLTPQACAAACSVEGFLYAGLEYGRECWCGNSLHGGSWVDDSQCDMTCAGEKTSFCGGSNRLTVYGTPVLSVAEVLDREYIGCIVDDASSRALSSRREVSDGMTAEMCSSICADYTYFGVEFGDECYCGNSLTPELVDDAECESPCYGDGTSPCGGPDRLTAYISTNAAQNAVTVGGYRFLHCGVDSVSDRVLKGGFSHGDAMTIDQCAEDCAGYTYFGLEFGRECFCGNEYTDAAVATEDCYMRCSGDSSQLCGGKDRIAVYDSSPLQPEPQTPTPTPTPTPSDKPVVTPTPMPSSTPSPAPTP